jgi:hypothetical protein
VPAKRLEQVRIVDGWQARRETVRSLAGHAFDGAMKGARDPVTLERDSLDLSLLQQRPEYRIGQVDRHRTARRILKKREQHEQCKPNKDPDQEAKGRLLG